MSEHYSVYYEWKLPTGACQRVGRLPIRRPLNARLLAAWLEQPIFTTAIKQHPSPRPRQPRRLHKSTARIHHTPQPHTLPHQHSRRPAQDGTPAPPTRTSPSRPQLTPLPSSPSASSPPRPTPNPSPTQPTTPRPPRPRASTTRSATASARPPSTPPPARPRPPTRSRPASRAGRPRRRASRWSRCGARSASRSPCAAAWS